MQILKQGPSRDAAEPIFCWPSTARSLPLVCFLSTTPLENTSFSFPRGYQLSIASVWGMEMVSTCPPSSRIPSGVDSGMPCACYLSLCELMCASILLCLERPCFLGTHHPLWLWHSFCLLFHRVPWAHEEFEGDTPFRAEYSKAWDSAYCLAGTLCVCACLSEYLDISNFIITSISLWSSFLHQFRVLKP